MALGPGFGFVYGLVGGAIMAGALIVAGFAGAFVVLLALSVLPFVNVLGSKKLKPMTKTGTFWILFIVGLAFGFFGAIAAVVG